MTPYTRTHTCRPAYLGHFHDGRDELAHEAGQPQQRRPKVVDEVDEQTLDVAAVVVLVRHDH